MAVYVQPPPPHAYTVEYRIADRCRVPQCELRSDELHGRAFMTGTSEVPKAGYLWFGNDKSELFSARGIALAPGGRIEFDLSATGDESRLDAELSSADSGGGTFRARVEVSRDGSVLANLPFQGQTAAFMDPQSETEAGRRGRFFAPVRVPLVWRADGPVRVVIENTGETALGLGAPVVTRRVDGRAPKHVVLVLFDAVAYPCLQGLFGTNEHPPGVPSVASSPPGVPGGTWIAKWVRDHGLYFREGVSPGQLTGSFVRRFFRGEFFRLDGEPSLLGQGFDDKPPARAGGPIARLAEQGFVTEAIGSNLYLSPILSRAGFDIGYNIESTLELPPHPRVLARRFDEEISRHAEEDALFVVWYANTHAPWREGRSEVPPMPAAELADLPVDRSVLDPMWRNLFDSVDSLREVRASADEHAPHAERIWLLGTDHGHTFTEEARNRPWRLTREVFDGGHMHCCLATMQEARTPFVIIDERLANGIEVAEPQSTMGLWQVVARRFGVELELPRTSSFALPKEVGAAFASAHLDFSEAVDAPVDEGIVVSVGNSGALAGRVGSLAYRAYDAAWSLAPAWTLEPPQARLLSGSPRPAQGVLAEELYDIQTDPGELHNLAGARFEDLLAVRSKLADFLAAHVDTPDHPRFAYTLDFERRGQLQFRASRPFGLSVDGSDVLCERHNAVREGARFTFVDEAAEPLGLIDVRVEIVASRRIVVTCPSSGLPVAVLDAEHSRLNLALARTNCPDTSGPANPPPQGRAWFWAVPSAAAQHKERRATPTSAAAASSEAASSAAVPELKNALRRWGYVRENR